MEGYKKYTDSSGLAKLVKDRQKDVDAGADPTKKLAAEKTYNQILNYGDFEYDVNGDALYQQYKDGYTKQGQLAMQDSIGKASAMTGGYGNSYAQQVGQQTFNGYMQALNDKIPELYALAYDKHIQGLNNLYKQYDLENNAYLQTYGEWMDDINIKQADIDSRRQVELTDHTNEQNYNATVNAAKINAQAQENSEALEMLREGFTYDEKTGKYEKVNEMTPAEFIDLVTYIGSMRSDYGWGKQEAENFLLGYSAQNGITSDAYMPIMNLWDWGYSYNNGAVQTALDRWKQRNGIS